MEKIGRPVSGFVAPTVAGSDVTRLRQRSARFMRIPYGLEKTRNQDAWLRPITYVPCFSGDVYTRGCTLADVSAMLMVAV